jgi:protein gp37
MADITKIQWCDSTVNPIMGCGGCELFPSPGKVLDAIASAMNDADAETRATRASVKKTFKGLVDAVFQQSENPDPGHNKAVNVTNIWHLRKRFHDALCRQHGDHVAQAASDAISKAVTCYAGILHLNKGMNILDLEGIRPGKDKPRNVHPGYAPIFESPTRFAGRAAETAELTDLLGMSNLATPWKGHLPRMIFVSDMGDALSSKGDFPFLKSDLMPAIRSDKGMRHLWLWLTKRPGRMAEFSEQIGGFPPNVCAMTTLTGPDEDSLQRLADLKKVKASIRGLSIEPLWNRIPPSKLDLKGIHWVIVGGESGSGDLTRPFALEWAEELREHCRKQGVAFFLKQLGRNPSRNGTIFTLRNTHGGNWDEWDETLRTREFPNAFHEYLKDEMVVSNNPRPVKKKSKKKTTMEDSGITREEKAEFKRQHKIVEKGARVFSAVGLALAVIKEGNLWRAGGYITWENYCHSVAGMSRIHAHRTIKAAACVERLKTLPRGNVLPRTEAQVRPLLRLPDPKQQAEVWAAAVKNAEGGQPTAPQIDKLVCEVLPPEGESPGDSRVSRSQRRVKVVSLLREGVRRRSWEQVEKLLTELETLI